MKAILLDSDQAALEPDRVGRATRLAAQHGISLIWQNPCHEALLLRHMPNCADRRPANSRAAQQMLRRPWPEYHKPMPRAQLAKRVDLEAVRQAAGVEPELRAFLIDIGLLP